MLLWSSFWLEGGGRSRPELRAEQSLLLQQSVHHLHTRRRRGLLRQVGAAAESRWRPADIYPVQAVMAEMELLLQLLLQPSSLLADSLAELLHLCKRLPAPPDGVSLHSQLPCAISAKPNKMMKLSSISSATCTRLMHEAFEARLDVMNERSRS